MDPDQPNETPNQPPPAAPAAQPAPSDPPDIQARIEVEAKKAKDAAWAEARRHYEGKAKGKDQPKPNPSPDPTPDGAFDPFALRDQFDDATSEMTLTKGQRQLLRDHVMTKRPSDVEATVRDYAMKAGWTVDTNTPNPNTPARPALPGRSASDLGAPAGTPAERASDVTKWTAEDVERHYMSSGGVVRRGENGELDLNDNRNAKIHKELRDKARVQLANVRVLLGPRRS